MMKLSEIRDLAYRFVPGAAADERLYMEGPRSWWPAHEIGHFLVATRAECRQFMFGLDITSPRIGRRYHYAVSREIAAISVSQRLLRRSGHGKLADEEIQFTDEDTIECSFERWCKRSVSELLRTHRITRLPTTPESLARVLARKAREVGTKTYPSRHAAEGRAKSANDAVQRGRAP